MATMTIHPKIKALRLRAKPFNFSCIPESKFTEMQTRAAKVKAEEGKTIFYFCVWGIRDDRGTGWIKGCFSKSIKERGPASKANQKIAFVWMHDIEDPIGRPTKIVEDDFGAYAEVEFDDPEAVPNSKRAQSQIESGTINGYSFGFDYIWDKMKYDEKRDTVWIYEAELFEISPYTFASIKETHTVRSRAEFESAKLLLDDETHNALATLPRQKQLEIRQLLTRHISLAKVEPDALEAIKDKTLKQRKPKSALVNRLNKRLSKTNIF